jgi:hypothetical protein
VFRYSLLVRHGQKNVRLTPIAPDSYPHSTPVVAYTQCHTFVVILKL